MRKLTKQLLTLGLAGIMAAASSAVAFAEEAAATIYGQRPAAGAEIVGGGDNIFLAILPGGPQTLNSSDIQTDEGWYLGWRWLDPPESHLVDIPYGLGDCGTMFPIYHPIDEYDSDYQYYYLLYLPEDMSVDSLGSAAVNVIDPNGNDAQTVQTTEAAQTAETAGAWASDEKGWWIQYPDGTYLTNAWYQSPESGLWYYMGADGYMLTNTITPDGCTVNADGVWIQ